ncbi:TadE family type IV pilus minor pilin [Nocardiopsis lambiniae]|uniref:TadE family type IV pilus minor pilin n=1 Tax=Nocardiopsis lambiniae TaxID=3075539 RepID=A0ABU2MEF7_9ACTN|nr:TadE family type IV pilus minor pilin [Nocardiopsis sp. DSM 44743]MDT0330942.1 TadE family type IV pilus minor pilin [Nocardiopsis sp. DSM 44743]
MRSARASDRGAVTVEAALTLPALLIVLAVAVGAVTAADARLACADAARVGARALARGESGELAREAALDAAPVGAEVHLARDGGTARVTVTAELRFGRVHVHPVGVRGTAAVLLEPGIPP